jgi:hypothetical protein
VQAGGGELEQLPERISEELYRCAYLFRSQPPGFPPPPNEQTLTETCYP